MYQLAAARISAMKVAALFFLACLTGCISLFQSISGVAVSDRALKLCGGRSAAGFKIP